MTRNSKERVDTIEALAAESFARHELRERNGGWWCSRGGSSNHAFGVWTAQGVIVVWGDLGEYVLRHNDTDSMAWLMLASSRDYVLGKVRACDGPKREFEVGDAWEELRRQKADIVAEIQAEANEDIHDHARDCALMSPLGDFDCDCNKESVAPATVNPDDAADPHYNDDRLVAWRRLADEFTELLEDEELEPAKCWSLAHYRTGDSEWPSCDEWSSSMLWLWEAIKTFRRLHRPAFLVEAIHMLRRVISETQTVGPATPATFKKLASLYTRLAVAQEAYDEARTEAVGGTPPVLAVSGPGGGAPGDAGGPQPGGGQSDGSPEVSG